MHFIPVDTDRHCFRFGLHPAHLTLPDDQAASRVVGRMQIAIAAQSLDEVDPGFKARSLRTLEPEMLRPDAEHYLIRHAGAWCELDLDHTRRHPSDG